MNKIRSTIRLTLAVMAVSLLATSTARSADWVVYEGGEGPGKGKHIVFLSGDEEYRSEEALPMLGKLLAERHGFKCTVLFALDPETGVIDPNNQTNIVGMENVADADLVVMSLRFRELPDSEMKYFVDFLRGGGPVIGLRTSTHAFNYSRNKQSPYAHFDFRSSQWQGGFGQQVLGDTWINHHGRHGQESCRGVIDGMAINHPVLDGVSDVWGPTDVYGIRNLPDDATILLHGLTLSGMEPTSPPNYEKSLMPVAWTREHHWDNGNSSRVFNTTMGAATDFVEPGLRRLVINACYWALEMEEQIDPESSIDFVGEYDPTPFGFGGFIKGVQPDERE